MQEHVSPFDGIRHTDEQGNEYWYARELSGTPASISLQEPSQKRKKPLETVGKPFQIICLAWDI